jgi:hypothetical protein
MSSPAREPLTGLIRQERKVVGGICLPEENLGEFIDQFNHCYGPLKMKIEVPIGITRASPAPPILPVGAGMFNPFRSRPVALSQAPLTQAPLTQIPLAQTPQEPNPGDAQQSG